MSSDNILTHLSSAQQEAVVATEGPILILAGAGSGKTRCITHRIAYLIGERRVHPKNILAVTFTNKAAEEMKKRVAKLLRNNFPSLTSRPLPLICTFHSLCAKILRIDGHHLGLSPNYVIYDESDQLALIREAMKNLEISARNFNPKAVLATISQAKNELISASEYPQYARGYFQKTVAKVFFQYQKLLRDSKALDFDDLLMETVRLFEHEKQVLNKYQNRFQYILVDEYQDTNRAQYVLTRLLTKKWENLCVVGDASQAIYSWRGADYRNLLALEEDFPKLRVFNLEQNYRSTQKILDAAFCVISQNQTHPILKLWTKNPEGEPIGLYQAKNEQDEARFTV